MKKRIKKRMAKMVPVLCVAAMVGLTACSSAKPAETKAPETKAEAASEKEAAVMHWQDRWPRACRMETAGRSQ